jgi:large subunit ribosomal protein L15
MLKNKKSKSVRQRGQSSHGWGHKKKHRGSGHRGGFGLAGTGARGDSQKSGMLSQSTGFLQKFAATRGVKVKDLKKQLSTKDYFGKKGFNSVSKKPVTTLSLSYIEHNYDVLVETGIISEENKEFVFDATSFGYDKILGKGNFTKKVTIKCKDISASAKTRVEEVGGKVVCSKFDEEVSSDEEKK